MNKRQDDEIGLILFCAVILLCFTISVVAFSVGQNVGSANAYKEMEKRIEVILHKQDSIIQKLEKEAQNDFERLFISRGQAR